MLLTIVYFLRLFRSSSLWPNWKKKKIRSLKCLNKQVFVWGTTGKKGMGRDFKETPIPVGTLIDTSFT